MIHKNCLHYYIDLLRMEEGKERSTEQAEDCVAALHNVIRSMRASRRDKICGEDFSRLDFGNIPINGIHFSKDGEQPCRFDGCRMNEWSFMSGHSLAITTVAWSHNGKYILTGSDDGTAILWDARTYLMLSKFEVTDMSKFEVTDMGYGEYDVAFSFDDKYCLIVSDDRRVFIWSIETEEVINSFKGCKAIFLHDNISCAIVERDVIKIYNYKTGEFLRSSNELNDDVFSIDFPADVLSIDVSADDKTIAVDLDNNNTLILESSSLEILQVLKRNPDTNKPIAFSPDHKLYLTASDDNTTKLWNTASTFCLHTLVGHSGKVFSAAFSSSDQGTLCITGSNDSTAKIWDVETGKCIKTLECYSAQCTSAAISKDQVYCFAGTGNGQLTIWDMKTRRYIKTLKGPSGTIDSLALSPDNNYYLAGSDDCSL